MDNTDRIKEYIQDDVIGPLERLMNGDSGEPGDQGTVLLSARCLM